MPNEAETDRPIPTTLAEITPKWLTDALRAGQKAATGDVVSIKTEVIGEERGFTGIVARLRPTYADLPAAGVPTTIIAKLPLAERPVASSYRERQQQDPSATRLYFERCAREIHFYQEIAPTGSVPTPICWFSAVDEANFRIVLLLEDLHAAQPGDALTGCPPAHIVDVLAAMAPLHACFWNHPELSQCAWLPRWIGDYAERQERYRQRITPFLARYGATLPTSIAETVERLGDRFAATLATLDRAPATLLHADLHLDNVMFNPPRQPRPVVILDWQSVARGPAAIDIAPFIAGSLPVVHRHELDTLLLHYHQLLVAHGVRDYGWKQFRDDCRLALLRQLAGIVGWLAQTDPASIAGREWALVEAALGDGRLFAALHATEALELLHD